MSSRKFTPEALLGIPRLSGPVVSLDGSHFAFVVSDLDSATGGRTPTLFCGSCKASDPARPIFRGISGGALSK
jgi:hypothetical protein